MADEPERLLCDTSFVGHSRLQRSRPQLYSHWDTETLSRIDAAILAISVVTLAESRYGFRISNWGERRVEGEERRLASFLQLPLTAADLDRWAELRVAAQQRGVVLSDNDIWIAAAAATNDHPLLTCDRDHERIADDLPVEVIYLPVDP